MTETPALIPEAEHGPASWRRPVFIGGTGRSGTWALGRMLGAPAGWRTLRTELRVHADPRGLAGFLRGELSLDRLLWGLRERWYRRHGAGGNPKGLQVVVDEDRYQEAVAAFEVALRAGVPAPDACRSLMLRLLASHLEEEQARYWVETTPNNAAAAGALARMFPDGRFLHAVRDGRDAAASVVSMPWGPDELDEALAWWEARVRDADASIASLPPAARHVVRLEELVISARQRTLEALLDFLAPEPAEAEAIAKHFAAHVSAGAANVGRWRELLDRRATRRFERHYRTVYRGLVRDGALSLPAEPAVVDQLASI